MASHKRWTGEYLRQRGLKVMTEIGGDDAPRTLRPREPEALYMRAFMSRMVRQHQKFDGAQRAKVTITASDTGATRVSLVTRSGRERCFQVRKVER